jgi:uncharacterized protein (TIGR03083 family)
MLDKLSYLNAFHSDSGTIAALARLDPATPLPSCPDWDVARLLGHLGAIYISITKNIRVGAGKDVVNNLEDLELSPEFERWFEQGRTSDALPPTVVEWFAGCSSDLEATLRSAKPGDLTWTWHPPDQTVGFWMRRMAQETAVHRWDVQLAHDRPEAIGVDLAADGVNEALTVYQPRWCRTKSELPGNGETYHVHQIDGPGEWTVRFEGNGMAVARDHTAAHVTIRGEAADLLLFFWHRIPADRLEVMGDRTLVDRYFELVPPD